MRPEQIEHLGKHAFAAHILTRKTLPGKPTYVLGFDSEFYYPDPDGGPVPICYQLADLQTGNLYPVEGDKLKLTDLTRAAYRMHQSFQPQAKAVVLLSWWSQAELSILDTDGLDAQLIPQGNGLFGLRWKIKPHRKPEIEFMILDLSAYFASSDPNSPRGLSLRVAAKEAGFEKLEYPVAELTPDVLNDEQFIDYAINDARLCAQIGEQLRGELNTTWAINPFGTRSVGHLTSALFQHLYVGEEPIYQPHPDVRELALLAYRGSGFAGGIWARGVLPGAWAEFDAVSMYPTAAREVGELPLRKAWRDWVEGTSYHEFGIYRAEFKWPAGVRHRMLMASVQRETGAGYGYPQFGVDVFSGFELKAAERLGCQVRIIAGQEYDPGTHTTPCLSQYLSHLVTHRDMHAQRGNLLLRRHYKALGNVMIGKLGQHRQYSQIKLHFDEAGAGATFEKEKVERKQLSTVFMPEWWVLITGYAKAVFGEVCAELNAVHGNVDAVLIADPGVDEFTRRGITFKRKAAGDVLKLVDRNTWALFQGGELVRMATYGGKQTPEVAAAFTSWTGQEIAVEVHSTKLVKLSEAAGYGRPMLSRVPQVKTMVLKAATTPLEDFEEAVDIRPVKRPTRRKPGDPPKGAKAAAARARLEASREQARKEAQRRGDMKAVLHSNLYRQEFRVFKSKALIRRELLDAARTIGVKLEKSTADQMVEALRERMDYRNDTAGVRVEIL